MNEMVAVHAPLQSNQGIDLGIPSRREGWVSLFTQIVLPVMLLVATLTILLVFPQNLNPEYPIAIRIAVLVIATLVMFVPVFLLLPPLLRMRDAGIHAREIMHGDVQYVREVKEALQWPFLFLSASFRQAYKRALVLAHTREAQRDRARKLQTALLANPKDNDPARLMTYLHRVYRCLTSFGHPTDVAEVLTGRQWWALLTQVVKVSKEVESIRMNDACALKSLVEPLREVEDWHALTVFRRKFNLDGERPLPSVRECELIEMEARERLHALMRISVRKNTLPLYQGESVKVLIKILELYGFGNPFDTPGAK